MKTGRVGHKRVHALILLFVAVVFAASSRAEVFSIMKLSFNPAVEGGSPRLLLEPNSDEKEQTIRIEAYALEDCGAEVLLATKEIRSDETLRFVLPDRGREDVLGVRVDRMSPEGASALAEWRAFYRPSRGVLDYAGSEALKRPEGFEAYWEEAKRQLAATAMEPEITPVPEKTTATGKLYRVKLNSYGGVPIVCWYYVPLDVNLEAKSKAAKQYPAIQIMPGWGAEEPPLDRTAEGYITLSLNPRSHGPSKEYFTTPVAHHVWNIDKPKEYYYRAAYMDCRRGLDFLASRPEVNQAKIGVEGGSQGGAFSLAMAALDDRVACAAANVPYISNFPDFVRLATNGSGQAFGTRMKDPATGRAVQRTLGMIDVSNLAPWIRCPTVVCVGLQDRVCPPVNGIVAVNRIAKDVPTRLVTDPKADHEVTPRMRQANQEWYEQYLK